MRLDAHIKVIFCLSAFALMLAIVGLEWWSQFPEHMDTWGYEVWKKYILAK